MAHRFLSSEDQREESEIQEEIRYLSQRSSELGIRPIGLDYLNDRLNELLDLEHSRENKDIRRKEEIALWEMYEKNPNNKNSYINRIKEIRENDFQCEKREKELKAKEQERRDNLIRQQHIAENNNVMRYVTTRVRDILDETIQHEHERQSRIHEIRVREFQQLTPRIVTTVVQNSNASNFRLSF